MREGRGSEGRESRNVQIHCWQAYSTDIFKVELWHELEIWVTGYCDKNVQTLNQINNNTTKWLTLLLKMLLS